MGRNSPCRPTLCRPKWLITCIRTINRLDNGNSYFILQVYMYNSSQICVCLFAFKHLFQFLLHYLKYLEDWFDPTTWSKLPLAQTCWSMLRDSYHSPLALRYKPQHIAIAVIYFALLCHGIEVPYNKVADTQWWKVSFFTFCNL